MNTQEHNAVSQANALLEAVGLPSYSRLHRQRMSLLVAARGFLAAAGGQLPSYLDQSAQALRNATEEQHD